METKKKKVTSKLRLDKDITANLIRFLNWLHLIFSWSHISNNHLHLSFVVSVSIIDVDCTSYCSFCLVSRKLPLYCNVIVFIKNRHFKNSTTSDFSSQTTQSILFFFPSGFLKSFTCFFLSRVWLCVYVAYNGFSATQPHPSTCSWSF